MNSVKCYCGGIMYGDGHSHALDCPAYDNQPAIGFPETPRECQHELQRWPKGLCMKCGTYPKLHSVSPQEDAATPDPTLRELAVHLGLGVMTAREAYAWLFERERVLRVTLMMLETHKSGAKTTEEAVRERIAALKAPSLLAVPEGPLRELVEKWRAESGSWEPGIGSGLEMCAYELEALLASVSPLRGLAVREWFQPAPEE